jgi:hypothetical protein
MSRIRTIAGTSLIAGVLGLSALATATAANAAPVAHPAGIDYCITVGGNQVCWDD